MATALKHPMNGHVEEVSDLTWLWALLFGVFYFMYRGIWRHVLIQAVVTVLLYAAFGPPATMFVFVMWVLYAVAAHGIVERSLLRAGYLPAGYVAHQGASGASAGGLSHLYPREDAKSQPSDASFAAALREWESPELRQQGLWARLYAQHAGDEAKAKAAYLSERAQDLAKAAS